MCGDPIEEALLAFLENSFDERNHVLPPERICCNSMPSCSAYQTVCRIILAWGLLPFVDIWFFENCIGEMMMDAIFTLR
jgi:hypothetical protein